MEIRATSRKLSSNGLNPVRAKYFIKDKICRFAIGSESEL